MVKRKDKINFPNWMKILIKLNEFEIYQLYKKLDITYANIYNNLDFLEHNKLIIKYKTGKKLKFKLTEKGKIIQNALILINNNLKKN